MYDSKVIAELGLSTSDVEAVSGKYVAEVIDYSARGKLALSQLFRRVDMPLEYSEIILPLGSSTISFEIVSQGNTVNTESNYSYQGQTIRPVKYGSVIKCDMEAIESPTRQVFDDMLIEAGNEWAKELELRSQTVALDLKPATITITNNSIGTSSLTPIIYISSVSTGFTVSSVDYYDGKVLGNSVSSATVTYVYSARCSTLGTGSVIDVNNKGSLSLSDVMTLKSTMVLNSINPDVLLVHPVDLINFFKETLVTNLFVSSKEYSDEEEVLNGELGELVGLKIISSNYLPQGTGIMADSSRLGYDVHKRELEGIRDDHPEEDRIWYNLWAEREYAISDTLSIGLITNLKTGLYPASDL